jgi:hypothetical protein
MKKYLIIVISFVSLKWMQSSECGGDFPKTQNFLQCCAIPPAIPKTVERLRVHTICAEPDWIAVIQSTSRQANKLMKETSTSLCQSSKKEM